jgi:hypothetical protein
MYLPKPIFRYWALFPHSFMKKYQKHVELFSLPKYQEMQDQLTNNLTNPQTFWPMGSDVLNQSLFKEKINYSEKYRLVPKSYHPTIMQDFISNSKIDQYSIRPEIIKLIEKS